METKNDVQEMDAGGGGFDQGRRRAMRKIAVGVGALAGLSVLPEQWTRPLIGRITIPAHAATSGEVEEPASAPQLQGCAVGAGCFLRSDTTTMDISFYWPGGDGSQVVGFHDDTVNCSEAEPRLVLVAIASDIEEARTLLSNTSVAVIPVTQTLPDGCSFYEVIN